MSFFPAGGANSTPPNPLAGFEGPLQGRRKREKRKEWRENERKEKDFRGGKKHPRNKFLVTAFITPP